MEQCFLPITTHPHGGAGGMALHLNLSMPFNLGKTFWDPSHAQGNFFSNPSM
jgi:hypothetical protein